MFTSADLKTFVDKGITPDQVKLQLENYEKGFPYIQLVRPATTAEGIHQFNQDEINKWKDFFERNNKETGIMKFVPASGAATRMFKDLFDYLNQSDNKKTNLSASLEEFFSNLTQFAFYNDLSDSIAKKGILIEDLLKGKDYNSILEAFLLKDGMNYGSLPKGLLKFHKYNKEQRTALEEHMVEAAAYAKDGSGLCKMHFTVSPEHMNLFKELVQKVKGKYEKSLQVKYQIDFSIQKSSTDILAVTLDNKPFRNPDETLLFRPGGHGALLENLQNLDSDIVFIKNIDNVSPDPLREPTILYKKALGGLLLFLRQEIYRFLRQMNDESVLKDQLYAGIVSFYKKYFFLHIQIPDTEDQRLNYFRSMLNRPIRVCGMVPNQGEPGGGPFWVKNDNSVSLQIVESSQINPSDPNQLEISRKATHFNPVDLVCAWKDYTGKAFNLSAFRDPSAGFITQKSKDGIVLKSQELPGLWNGSMAYWNTVFVEVPVATFSPVKMVNDLLRQEHQIS